MEGPWGIVRGPWEDRGRTGGPWGGTGGPWEDRGGIMGESWEDNRGTV